MISGVSLLVGVAGAALLVAATAFAGWRYRLRRSGRLVASDVPASPAPLLRSSRLRLAGRPDEIRERPDGRWVPVELKSRPAPVRGPPFSHRIQVAAYCLLIEEVTGRSPPYGILRYGDGTEHSVAWTATARREVLTLRSELARAYDGRATPSVGRCGRCPWRGACDRALA